jgi:serine O-acetyltransferase
VTFRECLAADLRRNYEIEVSANGRPSRLWKRILSPRFPPVLLARLAQYSASSGLAPISKLFSFANLVLFGIEISPKCRIGPGLYIPHSVGTVVGAAEVGRNAMIFQGVTLGAASLDIHYDPALRPVLGDGVTIGAGAKVLGGLTIGDGATVGANAVVTRDVLPDTVVVGIPARPIKSRNGRLGVRNEITEVESNLGYASPRPIRNNREL